MDCNFFRSLMVVFVTTMFASSAAADDWAVCSYMNNNPIETNIAACTRAIAVNQNSPRNLAYLYNSRGLMYGSLREYDRAISDFSVSTRFAVPNYRDTNTLHPAVPFRNRAGAYRAKGDFDRAIADYEKALQLNYPDETFVEFTQRHLSEAKAARDDQRRAAQEQRERDARERNAEEAGRQRAAQEQRDRDERDRIAEEAGRQRAAQEQRERAADLYRAQKDACQLYDIAACDLALRSSGADEYAMLSAWRRTAYQFNNDLASCKNGSVAACDLVISLPNVSLETQQYIMAWRHAASPWNKFVAAVSDQSSALSNYVRTTPTSTLVASGFAATLAVALTFLLLKQRSSAQPHLYAQTSSTTLDNSAPPPQPIFDQPTEPPIPPSTTMAPAEGMALKLKRSTRSSAMGKVIYILDARLDVSAEIRDLITKHRLGQRLIYESAARQKHLDATRGHLAGSYDHTSVFAPPTDQLKGAGKMFWKLGRAAVSKARAAMALRITVDSLIAGVHVECKDMDELLEAEDSVKQARQNLEGYIYQITSFDGREEVV